jgi:hypothetical protein
MVGSVVKKGSEDALTVGVGGSADYLELAGTSISAGMSLFAELKNQILEVCECVLLDPDKAAAAGTSSVALRVIFAPMIAKCDVLRMTYGRAIERIVNGLIDYVRVHRLGEEVALDDGADDAPPLEVPDPFAEPPLDESGNPLPANDVPPPTYVFTVDLPPREETVDVFDPVTGEPTGEQQVVTHPRVPGSGTVALEWGEYFKPTADDNQKTTASLSTAAGGKAIVSQKTAVELTANLFNRDPNVEWVEVSKENKEAAAQAAAANQGMFPPGDGAIGGVDVPDAQASPSDVPTEEVPPA